MPRLEKPLLVSTITVTKTEIPVSQIISVFVLYCGNKYSKKSMSLHPILLWEKNTKYNG